MERTRDNGSDDRLDGPVLDSANGQDYYKTNGTPRLWPESCVSRGPSTASCPPSAWGLAGSWGAGRRRGASSRLPWAWPPPPRRPSRGGGKPLKKIFAPERDPTNHPTRPPPPAGLTSERARAFWRT